MRSCYKTPRITAGGEKCHLKFSRLKTSTPFSEDLPVSNVPLQLKSPMYARIGLSPLSCDRAKPSPSHYSHEEAGNEIHEFLKSVGQISRPRRSLTVAESEAVLPENVYEDHLSILIATPLSSASPKYPAPTIGLLRFLPAPPAQDYAFLSGSIIVECLQNWPMAELPHEAESPEYEDGVCMKLCFVAVPAEPTSTNPGRPIARTIVEIRKATQMQDRVQTVRAGGRCVLLWSGSVERIRSITRSKQVCEGRGGAFESWKVDGEGPTGLDVERPLAIPTWREKGGSDAAGACRVDGRTALVKRAAMERKLGKCA
ncbi:hypothetical protein BJ875DRAFT_446995 [Amylocarpus encephaloides]|uniref:Uncharacterized protein n=1 Tax=Amylocarpus encephaloides TaxID=45428 RepID=A0A9P7Y7Y3_9HELO|nr:hypothetical protein BJ875DRAFT_446995 [Amylocarpus encephaloides]